MNFLNYAVILLFFAVIIVPAPFIGKYLARLYALPVNGKGVYGRIESFFYRLCAVKSDRGMNWKEYTFALMAFNMIGFLVLFFMQMFQHLLPLNPQNIPGVPWDLALNTAVSFMTNTNWQAYSGEALLGYFTQMMGLGVQNFVSAATGMVVVVALIRGFNNKQSSDLGNFWVDLTRSTLFVLLPLSILVALILVGQGVVQTFHGYFETSTLEGVKQLIPVGPAASQIAIKQLGTNGGGFFGVNSAHPFENPTPFSNFVEVVSILLIPFAFPFFWGYMTNRPRHGLAIFAAMLIMLVSGLLIMLYSEYGFKALSANMEGKEMRFSVSDCVLWASSTTAASNGSVNCMHDSLTPIAGMIAMFQLQLGEVIFGGVGAGMYGMLHFIILTVFIAGLMVGRSPEYLGKKIESFEVRMSMIAVLAPNLMIMLGTAIAVATEAGRTPISNPGPHGFSQVLYAFSSAAGNNGSAFAGIGVNTVFYNCMLALAMFVGRFGVIIPGLALAGSVAKKKVIPLSSGTFPVDRAMFVGLLIGVVLIIGGLSFFPALALGPIVDHLLMTGGRFF